MRDRDISNDPNDYAGRETLGDLTLAENYNQHLIELVTRNGLPGSRVLDFGAGNGSYAARIQDLGFEVEALEPDPVLREQILDKHVPARSLNELEPESFDLVYSCNVLEHIKDDTEALETIASLLKPGGFVAIYVPALDVLYSKFDERIGHYRRYSRERLRALCQTANLELVSLEFHDPLGFFAAFAYKLLDNSGDLKPGSIKLFDRLIYPASRALQPLAKRAFGKNLLVIAKKPANS